MKRARMLLLILGCGVCVPVPLHAWVQIHVGDQNTNPPIKAFQPTFPIPFRINDQGAPGINDGTDFTAIRNAFNEWANLSTATINFSDQGTTATTDADGSDGITLVTFADTTQNFAQGTVAVTFNNFNPTTGQITDSDIVFNTTATTYSTIGTSGTFDVQSVVLHEIGHLCGLDHILLMSSIMYPFTARGNLNKRSLTDDDIAGLSAIYPDASFATTFGTISGTVMTNIGGTPAAVFAGHVVAVDANGRPRVSTVIDSTDGTYFILGVPPGPYTVFVEPYDGPADSTNLTGGAFGRTFTSNFNTFFDNNTATGTPNPAVALATPNVVAGATTGNIDITVDSAAGANLTTIGNAPLGQSPSIANTPSFIAPGNSAALALGGSGLDPNGSVQISGAGITITNVVIGATQITMNIAIAAGAVTGPRNVIYLNAGATQNATLSGGLFVGSIQSQAGAGGGNPTPGRVQAEPGDGFIDTEWVDPAGVFDGVIVAVGADVFPAFIVQNNSVSVDPATGTEFFRGFNGQRLTIPNVTNGSRRFISFATFSGTTSNIFASATTKAVAGSDGINCIESFFGLGTCPEGVTPGGGGGGGGCFLATAAYGTEFEPEVGRLRQVRDTCLLPDELGTAFVQTYYANSPVAAAELERSKLARSLLRGSFLKFLVQPLRALNAPLTDQRPGTK